MAQWAQRGRRGGKATPPTLLAEMVRAVKVNPEWALITYNQNATVVNLVPADLTTAGATGDGKVEYFANRLVLSFDGSISSGNTINYAGTTPGFKTPDSVIITDP